MTPALYIEIDALKARIAELETENETLRRGNHGMGGPGGGVVSGDTVGGLPGNV